MLTVKSPLEFMDQLDKLYETGLERGESTGWKSVDEYFTVQTKQWTAVTGAPGSGKSEWLDALSLNLIRQGWQFIFFSPENQPHELHVAKHLEKWVGKPFSIGPTKRIDRNEYIENSIDLANRIAFITVDAEFARVPSVTEVLDTAGIQINQWRNHGAGQKVGLIIDPWNEMDHARPQNFSETEYVSQTLSIIRQFARDWDIHIFLVAHPTKLHKDKDGKYPVARLWDISGSAHFNNKADNGISVFRNNETGNTEIYVLKVRFKHIGQVGMAELTYDRVTGRYIDPNGMIKPPLHLVKAGGEICPI